jgi:hypothetical protein
MPKTLSKLQEQIVAKTLTIPTTSFVWCRGGEVNAVNNLRNRCLVKSDCYGSVQPYHLTDAVKSAFFSENDPVFAIENFHGEGWLIFDDRKYLTKVHDKDNAKRIVAAMTLLRETESRQAA